MLIPLGGRSLGKKHTREENNNDTECAVHAADHAYTGHSVALSCKR